jgi:hypothetical protein
MTFNEQVAKVIDAYNRRDRVLFVPGSVGTDRAVRSGNSWSSAFWAGYDGMTTGVRVPTTKEIARAWYAAGRKVKARE